MRILLLLLTITALAWSGIGNVGVITGNATLKRSGATLDVTNGMVIEAADEITSLEDSSVQVLLQDDTVVTIGPRSIFTFDAFHFGDEKSSEVKMHMDRGFFRVVTGKIAKLAPERYTVKTASSTIGVRGTDFSADVKELSETITCHKGKIKVFLDETFYLVDAGMVFEHTKEKNEIRVLESTPSDEKDKERESSAVKQVMQDDQIYDAQIADVTQQEEIGDIIDIETATYIRVPTVGFHDR